MNVLLAASGVLLLLAILFFVSMGRNLKRRRPIRTTRSLVGGVASGSLGGAGIALLFSYYGYARLIDEQPIGSIEFSQTTSHQFVARLMLDGQSDRFMDLRGNEWQLDAKVVVWKPPATLLGLDPIYKLDRLSGRYSSIEDEQREERTVHALSDENPIDVWQVAKRYPTLLPGVDAYHGTATFLPMADGARYDVSLTRTALIARPANDAARTAVGQWDQ